MLINGALTCPRCKVSALTIGLADGFRCDGCGRISDKNSWETPQADDTLESPYTGRPDLKAIHGKNQ